VDSTPTTRTCWAHSQSRSANSPSVMVEKVGVSWRRSPCAPGTRTQAATVFLCHLQPSATPDQLVHRTPPGSATVARPQEPVCKESESRARSNSSGCPRLPRPTVARAHRHQGRPTSPGAHPKFSSLRVARTEAMIDCCGNPASLAGGLRLGLRRDNWKVEVVELAEEAGHQPVRREQATAALKDARACALRLLSRADIFPSAM
jgi:hypothetical protein